MSSNTIRVARNSQYKRSLWCFILSLGIFAVTFMICYNCNTSPLNYREIPCNITYILYPIDSDHDWNHRFYCKYTVNDLTFKHRNCEYLPSGLNTCYVQGNEILFHNPKELCQETSFFARYKWIK